MRVDTATNITIICGTITVMIESSYKIDSQTNHDLRAEKGIRRNMGTEGVEILSGKV